jgi:hypothetical protein
LAARPGRNPPRKEIEQSVYCWRSLQRHEKERRFMDGVFGH